MLLPPSDAHISFSVHKLRTSVARLPALNKRDRILHESEGKDKILFLLF